MKSVRSLLAAIGVGCCLGAPATADTYYIDFYSNILGNTALEIMTSGPAGAYPSAGADITSIAGSAVLTYTTFLSVPVGVTGPLNPGGVDNKLYSDLPYVDEQGIAFRVFFGLFHFDFVIRATPLLTAGFEYEICTPTCTDAQFRGSFSLVPVDTQTPVPAALPLFATGLGTLGFAAWRGRRRRPAA